MSRASLDQLDGRIRQPPLPYRHFNLCSVYLNGNPAPPKAPVNTIVEASGIGEFDSVTGFTVQFTLIDNGEPRTSDQAGFIVFETANPSNVVLAFALMTITTGNIQAHVDQK